MKANTIVPSLPSAGVQKGIGLRRIIRILLHVASPRPVLRRQQALRQLRAASPQRADNQWPVHGVRDGLAHTDVTQQTVLGVERDVIQVGPRTALPL